MREVKAHHMPRLPTTKGEPLAELELPDVVAHLVVCEHSRVRPCDQPGLGSCIRRPAAAACLLRWPGLAGEEEGVVASTLSSDSRADVRACAAQNVLSAREVRAARAEVDAAEREVRFLPISFPPHFVSHFGPRKVA